MQRQIKITISQKMQRIIEKKAIKYGVKPSTYCFNVILEHIRKEVEQDEQ